MTIGWSAEDWRRLRAIAPGGFEEPEDLRRVIDWFGYLAEWRTGYAIRSARASLHGSRITCIDAALLSYGLMELLFGSVKRRLLAIHRRDPKGEECGHCVTIYWNGAGRIGAFGKSSFAGLGHRDAVYADELAIASSYAKEYLAMGFEPLYFGVTTLEEIAPDLDWRFCAGALNEISERLKDRYEYAFMLAR
ncbi:MAG TPA: hypothetical protein VGL86_24925 [Polyangia bacterium]